MRFEDLDVWKLSAKLATDILFCSDKIGNRALRDQLTRAALSISSNIAEGSDRDRDTAKDLLLFLRYARGSCAETRSQLYIGIKAGFIEKEFGLRCVEETKKLSVMIYNLRRSIIKHRKNKPDRSEN